MYPMGNIAVKPDFRLSMSSNPRPHQKQGGQKLSELVEQCLLGRQNKTFQLAQSCCQALRAPPLARLFACALADSLANDRDSLSLLRATFHHGICKSALILALTCSMTSALTVAFFFARRIFQSRDLIWSDRITQSMPSTWASTSNGCPLILVDIGQQTIKPVLPL